MEDVLIVGIIFFAIVAIVKIVSEHALRRKMIDRSGADASIDRILLTHPELSNLSSLKWGLVLIGIGLAAVISQWLPYYWSDESMIGLMFVLAGAGMLLYYPFAQRRIKRLQAEEKTKHPTA